MTRIVIADDHAVVRRGLRALLEARAGWEIVGEASQGEEVLQVASETRPDVTVLDYSMPGLNGADTIRRLRSEVPETEVLVFTFHETASVIRDVLAAGARGFVPKAEADGQLLAAVEALSRRQPFFMGIAAEVLLGTYLESGDEASPLSPREREVVRLVARSSSNKQIAHALGISIKTVETHRTAAMRKVGVTTAAALVRYAVQNGLG